MKERWIISLLFLPFISSCITTSSSLRQAEENKTFVAFSLNAAEARIKSARSEGKDFRKILPEVSRLGFMRRPAGLVFDPASQDIIIIGEKSGTPNLFLDDFVCALRSLYLYGAYPQLTIEPEAGILESKWHHVKMTRGIENSRFGKVFFESDYLLKKISLDLVRARAPGFKSQYRLMIEKRRKNNVYTRFWFKPVGVDILASKNALFINRYPIRVLSEVLYPKGAKDIISAMFAESFSGRFDEIAGEFSVFEDLRNALRWVGIVGSIQSLDFSSDLSFWLQEYDPEKVAIPEKVKGLNNMYGDLDSVLRVCGGVDSKFLGLRLKAKDATALDELAKLVINLRPSADSLTWEIPLQEYKLSNAAGIEGEYPSVSYIKAESLHDSGKYQDALISYDEVLKANPKDTDALVNKSDVLLKLKRFQDALLCAESALKIENKDYDAWYNKAEALENLNMPKEAIKAYEMFIKLAPDDDADKKKARNKIERLEKIKDEL